jgi:energy-coupling factor transporter ATP-binding protein EcfA2
MATSLLGIAREGDEFYVLNITDNYKARLVYWFKDLEERLVATLKTGTSVALVGPHGSGKSVVARTIAAKFIGEYYAVIDLGVDAVTFDSLLEVLREVPNAMGFYDPLGITFYDNPLVPRAELAATWMRRCHNVIDRALYLNARETPTLLVLPYDLFRHSTCRQQIEKSMKVIDIAEYMRHIDLPAVLREVFSSHAAALGCRKSSPDAYVEYLLKRHSDLSGVFALAAYGGRLYAKQRCATYKPERLYQDALFQLSKIYYRLYQELFFPTCREAKALSMPLLLSLQGQRIPVGLAHPLTNVDQIARRLSILDKIVPTTEVAALAREEVLEELRTLYTPQEELDEAVRWAVAPKESVVKESLNLTIKEHPCISIHQNPAQKIRIVYRGLLALRPEYLFEFAETIAAAALGKNDICREEVGKYFCFGDSVPQVVVEALALGRRITLETYTVIPTPCCVEDDYELMKQLALTDATRASAVCLEKFAETLYRAVLQQPEVLDMFYKLYRDYIEVTVERGTPPALRYLALAHYFSAPPKEAVETLKKLADAALASEDFKTAAIALSSLASVATDKIDKFLPNCECPFLRAFAAYNIVKKLIELGRHQEALKLLEVALAEVKREDPRHDVTPHFVQEVEKLYKEAALETLL